MPKPERVYCDMDDNYPNFYLYKGWHNDKQQILDGANSQIGIKKHCGDLGLEPVRIASEEQYKHIVEYLNDSMANSRNNLGIPIGFKWHFGLF
jgi:hypothetical protein